MSKNLFRGIVVVNLILSLIMFFSFMSAEIRLQNMIPQARAYTEWLYSQPTSDFGYILSIVGLLAWLASLVASIGLLFFYDWARFVFLISIIIVVALNVLEPYPMLLQSFEYIIDTCLSLVGGALLALIFYSPIKQEFH